MPFFKTKTNKNDFFPTFIIEWNKTDVNIRNSDSWNDFKRLILKFIQLEPNQVFNVDSRVKISYKN